MIRCIICLLTAAQACHRRLQRAAARQPGRTATPGRSRASAALNCGFSYKQVLRMA